MGVAHLLGDGAPALTRLGPRYPLLPAERLLLFGFDPIEVGRDTLDEVRQRGLPAWPVTTINGRPAEAAAAALAALERVADPLLVHFDVDAIDSTDYPLANFPHFNLGQPFDSAMTCLATFCGSSRFGGLVVTEVNPDHDADGSLLAQLIHGTAPGRCRDVRCRPSGILPCAEDGMAARKQWSDLSERTRRLLITAAVAEGILKVAAFIDLKRRPANQIRGPKWMWAAVVAVVSSAGVVPISYFVFGRRQPRSQPY